MYGFQGTILHSSEHLIKPIISTYSCLRGKKINFITLWRCFFKRFSVCLREAPSKKSKSHLGTWSDGIFKRSQWPFGDLRAKLIFSTERAAMLHMVRPSKSHWSQWHLSSLIVIRIVILNICYPYCTYTEKQQKLTQSSQLQVSATNG